MRKLLLALALWLAPVGAWAQCNGVFPPNTLCGNLGVSPAPPAAFSAAGTIVGPGATTSGHIATYGNTLGTSLFDQPTITTSQALNISGALATSAATFTGIANFTSQFQVSGNRIQFPVGPDTVGGLGTAETWTASQTFGTALTSIFNVQLGQVATTSPFSVGNGGTGIATIPAHSLVIGEGTAATSNSTAGTLGQCITSNGGSADPTFAPGCWTLLSTTTATSGAASISDLTHITSSYNEYELVVDTCAPVSTSVTLILMSVVNGAAATSNYNSTTFNGSAGTAVTSTAAIILSAGNAMVNTSVSGWTGSIRLHNQTGAGLRRWEGAGGHFNGTNEIPALISGVLAVGATVTGYQLQFGNGTIATCTAKLYGRL